MDTVTESRMAIAIAKKEALELFTNLNIKNQSKEVKKVKDKNLYGSSSWNK